MRHVTGVAMVTSKYFFQGSAFLESWVHNLSSDTKISVPLGGCYGFHFFWPRLMGRASVLRTGGRGSNPGRVIPKTILKTGHYAAF